MTVHISVENLMKYHSTRRIYSDREALIVAYNIWLADYNADRPITPNPTSTPIYSYYGYDQLRSSFKEKSPLLDLLPELKGKVSPGLTTIRRRFTGSMTPSFSIDGYVYRLHYFEPWEDLLHAKDHEFQIRDYAIIVRNNAELLWMVNHFEGYPIRVTYNMRATEYEGGFKYRVKLNKHVPEDDNVMGELTRGAGGVFYTNDQDLVLLLKIRGHKIWSADRGCEK